MKNPINRESTPKESHQYIDVLEQLPFSLREPSGELKPISLRPFKHRLRYSNYRNLDAVQIIVENRSMESVILGSSPLIVSPCIIEPEIDLVCSREGTGHIEHMFEPECNWQRGSISDLKILYGLLIGDVVMGNCAWRGYEIQYTHKEHLSLLPFALFEPRMWLAGHEDKQAMPPNGAP